MVVLDFEVNTIQSNAKMHIRHMIVGNSKFQCKTGWIVVRHSLVTGSLPKLKSKVANNVNTAVGMAVTIARRTQRSDLSPFALLWRSLPWFSSSFAEFEVGDSATSFEHRSFGEELDLCERYFQTYSDRLYQGTNEHAANYSLYLDGVFSKTMRAAPTATLVGTVTIARPQVGVSQRPNVIDLTSVSGFRRCIWPSSGTYGGQLGSHGDAYYRMNVGNGPANRIDFSSEPN